MSNYRDRIIQGIRNSKQLKFNGLIDYIKFVDELSCNFRYVCSSETLAFIKNLELTLVNRERVIPKNTIFYRAQSGCEKEENDEVSYNESPLPKTRMIPYVEVAIEGRANPAGIPYLYLSDQLETCLSEMRPGKNQTLTCYEFVLNKEIKIIDCFSLSKELTQKEIVRYSVEKKDQETIATIIWWLINRDFAKPTNIDDGHAKYVHTQYLAELFKSRGYDGLAFKSSLGDGNNIVLFDITLAKPRNGKLFIADNIEYKFSDKN